MKQTMYGIRFEQEKPMHDLQYKIDVMTAFRDGKRIESRCFSNSPDYVYRNDWLENKAPTWQWNSCDYRIAPEPRKPREWWLSRFSAFGNGMLCATEVMPTACSDPILVREVLPEDK